MASQTLSSSCAPLAPLCPYFLLSSITSFYGIHILFHIADVSSCLGWLCDFLNSVEYFSYDIRLREQHIVRKSKILMWILKEKEHKKEHQCTRVKIFLNSPVSLATSWMQLNVICLLPHKTKQNKNFLAEPCLISWPKE